MVATHKPMSIVESNRLLHELRIHQIELEQQNAELRQNRDELELRVNERTAALTKTVDELQREIAHRAMVERTLQESEAKYRALFEDAGDYLLVLTAPTSLGDEVYIIDVNHAACIHHGYTHEELIGKPISFLEDPSCWEKSKSAVTLEKPGDFCLIETVHVRKDGSTFPVEASLRLIRIGDAQPVIMAIERDISKRKQDEEAVREANQFSDQIIRCTQEGVIVYDMNLRYRIWNPFMELLTGMTSEEVVGGDPVVLFPFLQETGLIERLKRAQAGESLKSDDFYYTLPKSGKSGWCSQLSAPLRNTKGEIIGVISTIREITDRKHMVDALRQAFEIAKSANSAMSRLLRVIAHEFRTPLSLLTGCTDILDRYWDRMTPAKRYEQNQHIRSAARQMSNLVQSVMTFNSLGRDGSLDDQQLLDIDNFCRSVASEVEAICSAGHRFEVAIAEECGTALLSETLFRRVMVNLLTNAFRYTPSNGTIVLRVNREEKLLVMEIADTGPGMPEEDQSLVFDAFYRGRNAKGQRGFGLGLSIVSDALSKMGGTVTMNSTLGVGTAMLVEIPAGDKMPEVN
ncbi:MAG: hypothetical protein A2076_07455 [Geobacteraceae bacterium GWC2_53_11]|nr:MAG: hypothetical protein A2076_07455 [Geobacteraceae bacterium GWC2_53_11]